MDFLELYWTDTYKVGHKPMLPEGSILMLSNLTPRSGKRSNCPNKGKVVSFGQQKLVRQIKEDWDRNFFSKDVSEIDQFGRDMGALLGIGKSIDVSHFKELHKLKYLPLEIRAIEEGNLIPYGVPLYVVVNTLPLSKVITDWLVNYLETIMSAESWNAVTSATMSYTLRELGKKWIMKTNAAAIGFLDYQFHNFSMRGMDGKSSIINSGLGFATSSRGSDTLPVIPAARKYYDETEVCINSVIASEHAIMCSLTGFFLKTKKGSWEKIGELEVETFRYLLQRFPTGILSLVSDTWDLWRVITDYCVQLKEEILARDGKLVIRPDSGDPVDIVCGGYEGSGWLYPESTKDCEKYLNIELPYATGYIMGSKDGWVRGPKQKGVIELLWDIFGGSVSDEGYKVLHPNIGCIYGDSITYQRAEQIFERLEAKGFASTNIVLGIGSFTLQYCTRDTHGIAQKATYIELDINGEIVGVEIFKDPITDDGTKKSAKGIIAVFKDENGEYYLKDQCTWDEYYECELQTIFKDGFFYNTTSLTDIRKRLRKQENQSIVC